MDQKIVQMLKRGDSEAVQAYVKQNLPSDQAGLERIYNELVAHELKAQKRKQQGEKTKRSASVRTLPTSHRAQSENKQVHQTERIIKKLKERGMKANQGSEEEGLAVYERTREKIVKPLIPNSKVLKSQQAKIDRLIQRYSVNQKFYKNDIEDMNLQAEDAVDRDMKQFLVRRQNVLTSISSGQPTLGLEKPNVPQRYQTIESKLHHSSKKISFQEEPRMQKSVPAKRRLSLNRHLMEECADSLSKRESETVPTDNLYMELQEKLERGGEVSQVDVKTIFAFKKLRQRMAKQQYDRYTHTYMSMLAAKASNCKLNKHAKELIQDARKMRNIIDFSKQ